MSNWVRKFKFNYEQISASTRISEAGLRQRVYRGLNLHDLNIFLEFMDKNKKEIEEFVRTTRGDRQYKVIFCLNPQWGFDLKKAIIFET